MSLTVILKSTAAPGNIDEYANVTSVGGTGTNSGSRATEEAAFITGASTNPFFRILYTDPNNAAQSRVLSASDVKTVLSNAAAA